MQETAVNTAVLTPKQRRAIEALLQSKTNIDAAQTAGVSERQLYTWLKNPIFRAELMAAETAARENAQRWITVKTTAALEVISTVMVDDSASHAVRLSAAKAWLDYFFKSRDDADIDRRLTALEEKAFQEGVKHGS